MVTIRHESHKDWAAREALLDRVFGETRFRKTCEALRKGRLPSPGLAFGAFAEGELVGTVRLWDIIAGSAGAALLLGPLAVEARTAGQGHRGRSRAACRSRGDALRSQRYPSRGRCALLPALRILGEEGQGTPHARPRREGAVPGARTGEGCTCLRAGFGDPERTTGGAS